MTEFVIIGHNEGEYVDKMIDSLPNDHNIIYVADRCTDDTLSRLVKYDNVLSIDTSDMGLKGRQTSFCRNFGLSFTNEDSDVMFLDGDRFVTNGSVLDEISNHDTDIILFTLEDDTRLTTEWFSFDKAYGDVLSGFYSCGIFFRREAINRVKANPVMEGKLFPEFLQDVWGIEDTSLGDVCYSMGLTAELETLVRLRGCFEKLWYDDCNAIERRFRFRDKLPNVKWRGRTREEHKQSNTTSTNEIH